MTIKLLRQQAITNAVLYNSPVITSTFMNLVMVIFKAVCGAVEPYRPIQTGIDVTGWLKQKTHLTII